MKRFIRNILHVLYCNILKTRLILRTIPKASIWRDGAFTDVPERKTSHRSGVYRRLQLESSSKPGHVFNAGILCAKSHF